MGILLRFLKGHRLACVLAPLFKMLEAFLQLLVPLVMAHIIDVALPSGDHKSILMHALLLALMGAVAYGVAVTAQYLASVVSSAFGTRLRDELLSHLMKLSRQDIERFGEATLITRVTADAQQTQDGLNMFFRLVLRSPFVMAGCVVAAWWVDGSEGLIFLVTALVSMTCVLVFMSLAAKSYRTIQAALDALVLRATETILGVRVLRAFCLERSEIEGFNQATEQARSLQVSCNDLASVVQPLTYVLLNCGLVVLLWVGGLRIDVGALTQGQLVALVSYVSLALVDLFKLGRLVVLLARALASARRVIEVLTAVPSQEYGTCSVEQAHEVVAHSTAPALQFDHVRFSYPEAGAESLFDVSFEVGAGQTLGIIGGTGSGKSTIAALIQHLYEANKGAVLLWGRDIREFSQESLQALVAPVSQGAPLFSGTIRSNLRWGNPKASDNDLWEALKIAQADDFVRERKHQLDAHIERGGRNLSGGQRQRLAIARAVVARPSLLLLDDASSALDFATDARLRAALQHELRGTTLVTISQRITAVRHAETILVMDGGRVVGRGTHDELLKTSPVYQEICDSQLSDYDEEVSHA